jgi:uncharacterized protein YicC (UPF0701 family)
MEEYKKVMDNYIREKIEVMEQNKKKLQKQIEKIISNYSARDIEKLNKISNEINEIDYAIVQMYALIGGMDRAFKKTT